MRTHRKFLLLTTLYFSQGLPFGFFIQALPVLLRKQGTPLGDIGLSNLLALPWALKFLWAPLVDRYGSTSFGRRKSWIVPVQALLVLALVPLAIWPPQASLRPLLVAVLIANLLAATQDIATDALAVDLLSPAERGIGNGIQVGGYRLGMIVGGGALLIVFDHTGWEITFASMAALLVVASIPIALAKEPLPRPAPEAPSAASPSKGLAILSFFRRPDAWRMVGLLMIYKMGDAFGTGMVRPFFADLGLSLSELGILLGTVGSIAGLVGALTGGALSTRLGPRRALITFGFLQTIAMALYTAAAFGGGGRAIVYTACFAEHIVSGMGTAALFASMMDYCRPDHAASDYTLQASLVVVATGGASVLSGFSAQRLGYGWHFYLSAILAGLAVPMSRWLLPRARSGGAPTIAPA